ncbi:MAG: glutamate--cysteine ligase [Proteobacteria bacterium]|nr:MAG: glutamate--cysteine ligase [Pseudomonadota bacterium]
MSPVTDLRAELVEKISAKQKELDSWLNEQCKKAPAPPYTSIDLRDSGFKMSPVDSNIFPAGFNNICVDDWNLAASTFERVLTRVCKGQRPAKILIVPENHTSNLFYFENLWALKEILTLAKFEVVIGHLNPAFEANLPKGCTSVKTQSGRTIVLEKIIREGNLLQTERVRFESTDLVLLNNDLSGGVPAEVEGLAQTLSPHPSLGWHRRTKSEHLRHYTELATEFAGILGVDPWLFTTRFASVDNLDFDGGAGMDRLAETTDKVLGEIRADYKERGIDKEAHVFIKHNSGTYGRSIMTVRSGKEVLELNRREKNKMNVSKGGVQVHSVVIMEGIPTDLKADDETAEPVVYLAGSEPIGGFLRLNPNRDAEGNLNSPGAHFKPLCFANLFRDAQAANVVLEKLYGALGRLSTLANGREIQG